MALEASKLPTQGSRAARRVTKDGRTMSSQQAERWALILGASSGFGAATARALARDGVNIFGVHLDLKSTLPRARAVVADIEASGRRAVFFNTNAADARKRQRVLDRMAAVLEETGGGRVDILLHSLAFGTLLPFVGESTEESVSEAQMDMTFRVMAHSLVYWVQDLVWRGMLGQGSKVLSMTSSGSHEVIPTYGAVSGAKAALESHTRQLAMELGPKGIQVNCIEAGVTDTPALRAIPVAEELIEQVLARHPRGRMTTPEDVAKVIVALSQPEIDWISGTVIVVDGGYGPLGL